VPLGLQSPKQKKKKKDAAKSTNLPAEVSYYLLLNLDDLLLSFTHVSSHPQQAARQKSETGKT